MHYYAQLFKWELQIGTQILMDARQALYQLAISLTSPPFVRYELPQALHCTPKLVYLSDKYLYPSLFLALLVLKTWVKIWVVLAFRTSPTGQVGSQTFKIAMPRYGQCAWRLYLSVTLVLSSRVATRYKCLEF